MFDYFREPKTPEEKKHREEMEAARLRRIQILKERSDEQLIQEAFKRDEEQLRKEREERAAPKDVKLTNPRWQHADETIRNERPDEVYVGETILLFIDQEHGNGKNADFNIHDNNISSKIDPNREVHDIRIKMNSPTCSVKWVVTDPRSNKEKDREMKVYFYVRSGKDFSENCDIKILENPAFTIADTAEILKSIESEEGLPAARFFASHLDYKVLCKMATTAHMDSENDPNLMPTRFMLIPGADDSKLLEINDHPDNFENGEEHKVDVLNLQRGLNLLGSNVPEDGLFDKVTEDAFMLFLESAEPLAPDENDKTYVVEEAEDLGTVAGKNGMISWKYLYEINKEIIGDNPDILPAGTKLTIPGIKATSGDEKIKEKGYTSSDYMGGLRYRCVWVPFSLSLLNSEGKVLELSEETTLLLKNKNEQIIYECLLNTKAEIEVLVPDAEESTFSFGNYFLTR